MSIDSDRVADTERRLMTWARSCREPRLTLGMPTVSHISRMADHVRAEDRLQTVARRQTLRAAREAWKAGDPTLDAKIIAEELGQVDAPLTARGKQTMSFVQRTAACDDAVLQIDQAVARLPDWAKAVIFSTYMCNCPDRIGAQNLRIKKTTYASRRRAAVELVAGSLV